jgi:hypothetical protein
MKLQFPFIQLPLSFDAPALAAEIAALGEGAWKPHPNNLPGNSMLPLVSVGGDADNEAFAGPMQPTPALERCPYLRNTIASFGAVVGRSRLMRLAGQAEVTRHVDTGYYWAERTRVHVPIVTQPSVRFECGDAAINMGEGECWIFDTWRQHRVLNDARQSRIHLVVDTVGGAEFWNLVARGKPHHMTMPDWTADRVSPGGGATFACESNNVPAVMTPWELNTHFGLLFGESPEHPNNGFLRGAAQKLLRAWRGLWAQYGEAVEGRAAFRDALRRFMEEVRDPGSDVVLRNDVDWYTAMLTLVASNAVHDADAPVSTSNTGEYGVVDRA